MAALVGFLMFTWGMLPVLRQLAVDPAEEFGELMGQSVTPHMFQNASRELERISAFGFMEHMPMLEEFILFADLEEDEQPRAGRITSEAVWRYMILTRKVDKADLIVFDHQVDAVLEQFPPQLRDQLTYNAVKNWMGILQLISLQAESFAPRSPEMWMEYAYENHRIRLQYVKIDPDMFAPVVEVSDEEIEDFYEQHKDRRPDRGAGVFGYLAPERVRLEYACAVIEDLQEEIEVSEEAIRDYYEENKERYRIEQEDDGAEEEPAPDDAHDEPAPDNDGGTGPSADEAGEGEEQGGEGEESPGNNGTVADEDGDNGADANDDDDIAVEDEEPDAAPEDDAVEPVYRPLSEVRDEIKSALAPQKAEQEARRRAESVLEILERIPAPAGRPRPLRQHAGAHGLRYVQVRDEDGNEYLSREALMRDIDAGQEIAQRVFDEEAEPGLPKMVEGPDGPFIVQVLERKEPAPAPLEEVRDRVEQDLIRHLSLEKASQTAGRLKERAEEEGFREAVKEEDRRLVQLLGVPEPGRADSGDEGGDAANDEVNAEDEDKLHYLALTESGLISLARPMIGGAVREDMVKELLKTGRGELVVMEDAGYPPASFVLEKTEEMAADREGFEQWKMFQRHMELGRRLEGWLRGLQERHPPPSAIR